VPDVDLCAACFSAGKMPPGLSSSDFLRMDPPWKHDSDGTSYWTNQETLLLLEALEMHGAYRHRPFDLWCRAYLRGFTAERGVEAIDCSS
jgi:hypothetical protein